jgi:hypothetical protein
MNKVDGIPTTVHDKSLASRIEEYFDGHMKNINVPLFKDFDSYSKSLPVRFYYPGSKIPEYVPLFKVEYCAQQEDLTEMVDAIMDPGPERESVKYVSAPTRSGKTSSVLPAFLRSTSMVNGGTHYIYLAFHNNNNRSFESSPYAPSSDEKIAERQGAAFMVECVRTLLEHPDDINRYAIKVEESPELKVEGYSVIIGTYLTEKLGGNLNIFFHLDEHARMCSREEGDGAAFSRGAMTALACAAGVTVIATYIERPSLPTEKSSQVCRNPIPLPSIDITQVMSIVPELTIDASNFSKDEQRLLASLKVRLGFKFREMDLMSILYHRGSLEKTEKFLGNFAEGKKGIETYPTKALERLNMKITLDSIKKISPQPDVDATQLLLSFKDSDKPKDRQLSDVVSLPGGRITVSVLNLLSKYDPMNKVYGIGRTLFRGQLVLSPDLISGSPLEAAYYWTLACRSATSKVLEFPHVTYSIDCKDLIPARLFSGTDSSLYNLDFLKHGIIYYSDEKVHGRPTHPLADLFFITKDNELVLVDIYGGMSMDGLRDKRKDLTVWIKTEQVKIPHYKLRGVVLAPNLNIQSRSFNEVCTVTGEDAVFFLGGLKQILRWLE